MVKSNLKVILDDRKLSLRQVSRDIEYRLESIRSLYNDEMERYPRELIHKLCLYLKVTPGEILILDNEEPTE